jgi:SAM-dependent methyltransferase
VTSPRSFDPVWTELHAAGRDFCRWPCDHVVSFVYREAPRDRPRAEVRILEVGCGAGPNVWFAAREGFSVAGVDASAIAVAEARGRLEADGLEADVHVADFVDLPFADASFDLAIDRAAITCAGRGVARRAIAELHRVLAPGGKLLFNPYSDRHESATSGVRGPDGVTVDIDRGALTGVGQICFYSRADVDSVFGAGWELMRVEHVEATGADTRADWRVVAKKIAA